MKRIFTALAAAAIVNMMALGGVLAYAKVQHWLTRDRMKKAVAALTGEEEKHDGSMPTSMPAKEAPVAANAGAARSGTVPDEVAATELDRRAREIQDGWKLLETQQLALVRDREEFEETKARLAAEAAARSTGGGDAGMAKEIEIIGGVKPKQAKDLLRQKKEPDVAAILKSLDERKVRKIVGECKTEEDRQWIGRILEQLHDHRAAQAEVLNAGTQ